MEIEEKHMRRALSLASRGRGFTAPNPMVGAVIVGPDGRVIGEGWHRRFGQAHAEVNAVASVGDADRGFLKDSTMYVTLEPCSHYGKTPPCARLIIDTGIPRVVVGAGDPNPKVDGRGIAMLREAGVEVVSGVLARESRILNKVFFTSQILRRPYITLKWAQSADGYMDWRRTQSGKAFAFSSPLTRLSTMKLRAENEAILTTASTVNADNPRMNLRGWAGRSPRPFIIDRSGKLDLSSMLLCNEGQGKTVVLSPGGFQSVSALSGGARWSGTEAWDILTPFQIMYDDFGITSVLVEAGPRYLSALLDAGLWDSLRVEIADIRLGERGVCCAPVLPCGPGVTAKWEIMDDSSMLFFEKEAVGLS